MLNGKYKVIDTHCHVYPDPIAEKATHNVDARYDMHSVHTGELSDLLRVMDEDEIDHCVICYCATHLRHLKMTNELTARNVELGGGRVSGLGSMHQDSPDKKADLQYIKELGLVGVKLHPDMQDFVLDSPEGMEILSAINDAHLPVLIHTGDYRYDFSNSDRVLHVLQEFPDMTIIGGHFGGYPLWLEASRKLHGFKNFYVDCSSSSFGLTDSEYRECIELYGADHVLFGTDYPMWPAKEEFRRLLGLGLDESDYQKIFSENAARIYNLSV